MIRGSKIERPDKILTGDWHLRESVPICRTDDFEAAQWRAVDFIADLQRKWDCDVEHSGDLFDFWKPSPSLLTKAMIHLPKKFRTNYGNHDLPQHSMMLAPKSGTYCLEQAGFISTKSDNDVDMNHFKEEPPELSDASILVWHLMVRKGKKLWPGQTDPKAGKLLRKYPQYDLILTGDNHASFTEDYEGRLLVNPGSLTRQEAGQIDFKPSVYLYYASTNSIKRVFLPIESGVISREHLEAIELREARIDAFVSTLDADWEIGMSFNENLRKFFQANDVKKSIMNIIHQNL